MIAVGSNINKIVHAIDKISKWPKCSNFLLFLNINCNVFTKNTLNRPNENKLNNSADNLEVMLKGEHVAFHCRKNKQPKDLITGRFISNKGDDSLRIW